ncbi:MAG: ergothioneine biosynthesis protein EgtB [Acidimicrobiales bacterium]
MLVETPITGTRPADAYRSVRELTEALAAPLLAEDQVVQSMADVSPTKWHRAHVTWFFETFLLTPGVAGYRSPDPAYAYLFNSYYEAAGPRHPRAQRGLLSRPSVADVAAYRRHVDEAMTTWLESSELTAAQQALLTLGLHHEQQHQELLLMDAKHVLGSNPLRPAYRTGGAPAACPLGGGAGPLRFVGDLPHGLLPVGRAEDPGFGFDNESPRHEAHVRPFELADRLVTCGEWLAFMADGGYERPELWLSDGWATVQQEGWRAPLYWEAPEADRWSLYTLDGLRPVQADEPVVHVSFFEADAFARWAGARLPSEHECEVAALAAEAAGTFGGNLLDRGALHPLPAPPAARPGEIRQLCGDVWEWTASPYLAYPGFRPAAGAVGEYNGKFMNGQYVLRGGAAITPAGHVRPTYRNFFPPHARWMFGGLRLAR